MVEEKIINNEQLTEEQLENIAGGNYRESYNDMMLLYNQFGVKFFHNDLNASVNRLGGIYQRAGTKLHADNRKGYSNQYFDGYGRPVDHKTAINDLVYKIRAGIVNINDLR